MTCPRGWLRLNRVAQFVFSTLAKRFAGQFSKWRSVACVGLVLLLGLIVLRCPPPARPEEPVYAGKTVDQWLNAGFEDASLALRQIGPAAVPFILAKLSREDSRYGWACVYRDLRSKLPRDLGRLLPQPKTGAFDELHACGLLLELGPQVISLLPGALHDKNPAVRELSAHALGSFRRQGKDIRTAEPRLMAALNDPVGAVRARAAWALEQTAGK